MDTKADIVIIGAGIVGTSAAWELAQAGVTNVVVVDQGPLAHTGTEPCPNTIASSGTHASPCTSTHPSAISCTGAGPHTGSSTRHPDRHRSGQPGHPERRGVYGPQCQQRLRRWRAGWGWPLTHTQAGAITAV